MVAQAAAYQTAPAPAHSPPADGDSLRRVFADYAIYKGKAAMCLKVSNSTVRVATLSCLHASKSWSSFIAHRMKTSAMHVGRPSSQNGRMTRTATSASSGRA